MRRSFLKSIGLAGLSAAVYPFAHAQDFPNRPIRIIVPFGPGSGVDVGARLMSTPLSKLLGQPVIVENRPGAGAAIGTALVANAAPDGYTILAANPTLTSVPAFSKAPGYSLDGLTGVSNFSDLPAVMVTAPASGYKTLKQFVDAAKANPGKLTFASAGVGTITYLASEKLHVAAGIKLLHVPYKSTSDSFADVMAGRVDYIYTQLSSALGQIRAGKLVALAISQHSAAVPDVPTLAELGYPAAGFSVWVGFLAPAKTPRDVIARLYDAIQKVRDTDEFKQQVASQMGGSVVATTPEKFTADLKKELADNEELVKKLGIAKE